MTKEESLIDQFKHEHETWKRILGFLVEENINLKNRLSAILQNTEENGDLSFVERIEYFQNQFLKEDEIIGLLKLELNDQENLLERSMYEDHRMLKEVQHKQKKLRTDVEYAEQRFNKLKFEFNNYLGDVL